MPPAEGSLTAAELRQRRIVILQGAAVNKRRVAVARAEKALRHLIKMGKAINFRTVADVGDVSVNFLYTNPDLRARIEHLRALQNPPSRPLPTPTADSETSIVRTLTAKLSWPLSDTGTITR